MAKKKLNIRYLLLLLVNISLIIALLGLVSYAWLYNHNALITMAPVIHSGNIAITGPDGQIMDAFDLSYTNDDITFGQDGTKTVKIRRDFCVKSTALSFQIEIVHTTNMSDLSFSLYRENEIASPLEGTYINLDKENNNHKYANSIKHEINFDGYDNVQIHAEPLYWKVNNVQASNTNNTMTDSYSDEQITYYLTNYQIEISWTEADKETDIFYVLAKNVE